MAASVEEQLAGLARRIKGADAELMRLADNSAARAAVAERRALLVARTATLQAELRELLDITGPGLLDAARAARKKARSPQVKSGTRPVAAPDVSVRRGPARKDAGAECRGCGKAYALHTMRQLCRRCLSRAGLEQCGRCANWIASGKDMKKHHCAEPKSTSVIAISGGAPT